MTDTTLPSTPLPSNENAPGEQASTPRIGVTCVNTANGKTGRKTVAYRGGRLISDCDATAHLASILRLENIGVLLGAGASVGAGGMTMTDVWTNFVTELNKTEKEFMIKQNLVKGHFLYSKHQDSSAESPRLSTSNAAPQAAPAAPQAAPAAPQAAPAAPQAAPAAPQAAPAAPQAAPAAPQAAPAAPQAAPAAPQAAPAAPIQPHSITQPEVPNIEEILDNLEIAISQWQRVDDPKLNRGKRIKIKLYQSLIRASKLKDEWWGKPLGPSLSETELSDHRKMLQRISSLRQPGQPSPWIFTTNYDLAVEWAADSIDLNVINGFFGIHSRKFSPQIFDLGFRNVRARGEARFGTYNVYLAKLHGSLTWKSYNNKQFYEVQANEAWSHIAEFCKNWKKDKSFPFAVLPSAAKYIRTVGFIFGELMRRFAEFTNRSQTALIISGYGFGDEHINRLLRSALLNPTLQLVIYIHELKGLENIGNLPKPVQDLINIRSSRITVIDGSFNDFVTDLPIPAIGNSGQEGIQALENIYGDEL